MDTFISPLMFNPRSNLGAAYSFTSESILNYIQDKPYTSTSGSGIPVSEYLIHARGWFASKEHDNATWSVIVSPDMEMGYLQPVGVNALLVPYEHISFGMKKNFFLTEKNKQDDPIHVKHSAYNRLPVSVLNGLRRSAGGMSLANALLLEATVFSTKKVPRGLKPYSGKKVAREFKEIVKLDTATKQELIQVAGMVPYDVLMETLLGLSGKTSFADAFNNPSQAEHHKAFQLSQKLSQTFML